MNLEEAIACAENRSRNINLHWFVCEWNDGYIIHSTGHMLRHPEIKYVWSTGDINKVWRVYYDEKEKIFKHIIKTKINGKFHKV